MSKLRGPSSSLNLLIQRLQNLALLWRSSTLRVWLPSQRFYKLSEPLHPSFRIQRSWALPCKALLLLRDPKKSFLSSFRSCASRETLTAFTRRSSDFLPRKKPYLCPLEV
jgi:hypothetical protein